MVTRGATKLLSPVPLSCSPMDYTPPPPLSRGFARLEYWSGLPFSSLGDLPDPGIEPSSPALADKILYHQATMNCILPKFMLKPKLTMEWYLQMGPLGDNWF